MVGLCSVWVSGWAFEKALRDVNESSGDSPLGKEITVSAAAYAHAFDQ